MTDLLAHFEAARQRVPSGQEACGCCGGSGEHVPEGHECYRCDASGSVSRGSKEPYCDGQRQPRRRHWRQKTAAVTINYAHNTEPAPDMGEMYAQHVEPNGRYLVEREPGDTFEQDPRWETGSITFQNPLHMPFGGGYREESNWKHQLSRQFGGRRGRALSYDVAKAGHDGIITHDEDGSTREIVDLTHLHHRRQAAKVMHMFAWAPGNARTAAELFHGSDNPEPFERFDFSKKSLKHLDQDEESRRIGEEVPESRWWNSRLGSHFTSEHSMAAEAARSSGEGHIYHVDVRMNHPKDYPSEHDLAREGFQWARRTGYKGLVNYTGEADALQQHPQAQEIAEGFRRHLQSQGHDGITYGNEYEQPIGHRCAIIFHPDQAHITETHGAYAPCRYDPPDDDDEHTAAKTASEVGDYGMEMRPDEEGDPLHAMGSRDWPNDFYDRIHEYDFSHGEHGYKHLNDIRRARGNPEKMVTVYRAAPALNPESRNNKKGEINHGDWVTLNRSYAAEDARGVNERSEKSWKGPNDPGRSHIWSARVPAKHVRSAGNDLMEWGYWGEDKKDLPHVSERCSHRNPYIKRERSAPRRSFWDTDFAGKSHYGARQQEGDERPHGDYTMRYRTEDQGERKPRHIIETFTPGNARVGELNWYGTTGVIHHLNVADDADGTNARENWGDGQDHRRKGIATAMWNWGQEMSPSPKHSGDRTPQGAEWAKSVRGPGLRRHRGAHEECADHPGEHAGGTDAAGHRVHWDPGDSWHHLDGSVSEEDGTCVTDHPVHTDDGQVREADGTVHQASMTPRDEVPPDPGSKPIPEGHIRLWHYTSLANADSIREHGLQRKYARGDSGTGDLSEPSAGVWASTKRPDDVLDNHSGGAAVVEYHAHPEEISQNAESPWQAMRKDRTWDNDRVKDWAQGYHHVIMRGDVHPDHILDVHEPWHGAARYMRHDDPSLKSYQWIKDESKEPWNDHLEPYRRGLRALEKHAAVPAQPAGPLFHGTRSILHPDELLTHEDAATHPNNPDIHAEPYVHATTSGAEAHQWGWRADSAATDRRMAELGRQRPVRPGYNQDDAYPPRVYHVEPTGPIEPDPHEEGAAYRTAHPLRVVREVRPLGCYASECADDPEHWPDHPHYQFLQDEQEDEDGQRHEAAGRMLDLYHHTGPESAREIMKTKAWETKPGVDDFDPRLYFSDRPHEEASRHGPVAIHVRVPESLAEVDDEFPSGETHYTVPLERQSHIKIVGLEPKEAAKELPWIPDPDNELRLRRHIADRHELDPEHLRFGDEKHWRHWHDAEHQGRTNLTHQHDTPGQASAKYPDAFEPDERTEPDTWGYSGGHRTPPGHQDIPRETGEFIPMIQHWSARTAAASGSWHDNWRRVDDHLSLHDLGKLESLEVPGHTMAEVAAHQHLRDRVTPGEWSDHLDELAADIREHGFEEPVRIESKPSGQPYFGDGHHRYMAASDAGIDRLPVQYRDEETRAAMQRFLGRHEALAAAAFDWSGLTHGRYDVPTEAVHALRQHEQRNSGKYPGLAGEVAERGIEDPLEVSLHDDGRVVLRGGSHRVNIAHDRGYPTVPVQIVDMRTRHEAAAQRLYHGTTRWHEKGSLIQSPADRGDPQDTQHEESDPSKVYASDDPQVAGDFALLSRGMPDQARVYEVRHTGPVEPDPHPRHINSFQSDHPMKVVRQLDRSEWSRGPETWRSGEKLGDWLKPSFWKEREGALLAHFGATDWDESHAKVPEEIHRGLYAPESHGVFSMPMSDEDIAHGLIRAHQEEHYPYERDQHQLFGTHWTSDEGVARNFAKEHERNHFEDDQCPDHDEHFEATPVVFHAQRPQRHEIEDDPRRLGWQNVDDYTDPEHEVPIRHGAPVRIKGVSWLTHTGLGPMWHRHDLREPVELRAEDRDSPSNPNEWNASLHTGAVFMPTQRIFGPTTCLDKDLFDGDKLKPQVRDTLLARLDSALAPVLGSNWEDVASVHLAGSQVSLWTDADCQGNGDLDTLIGIAYTHARNRIPQWAALTDEAIDKLLNTRLREHYNADHWHPAFAPGGREFDLTGYVNADAIDIRKLNPYAAWDLLHDDWTVRPPELPAWSPESFPQGPALWQEARGLIAQVRAILRLPEPFRAQEAKRIWNYIHEGRRAEFSEEGMGWLGTGNVLEKALDQASGELVGKLKAVVYGHDTGPQALGHGMTDADLEPAHG